MKHLRTGAWIAGLIFSLPLMAGAQGTTIAELEALIRSLSEQLKVLQAQQGNSAPSTVSPPVSAGSTCGIFVDTLRIGSAGHQVARLHAILAQEGFSVSSADLSASRYGEVTARVVSGLQEKYRSEILTPAGLTYGTGIVGASTRAKLNRLACTNAPAQALVQPPVQTTIVPTQLPTQTLLEPTRPSILLGVESGGHASDGRLSVKLGESFRVWGTPQGLQGLSYFLGYGSIPPGYYVRAFYTDPIFGACSKNEASTGGTWTLNCTPTALGTGSVYVAIHTSAGTFYSNTITVTVLPADAPPPPPPMEVPPPTAPTPAPTPTPTPTYSFLNILTNWNLPSARVGEPYQVLISATGSYDPYEWSHTSGTLPPGMQALSSCSSYLCERQAPFSLSGTPTTPGTYTFTFLVQSGQQTAVRMFNLTVTGDTPPATTPATAIIGYLDAANCDIFGGWTLDQDSPSSQLQIEVWSRVDNLYWKKIMTALANVARADITAAYNAGDHAFSFYTPSSLKDGKTHSIYIYARNPRGEYVTLSGSGTQQLRCTSVSQNSLNQIANSIQAIQAMIKNLVR